MWLPKNLINTQSITQSLELYPTNDQRNEKTPVRLWKETKHHLVVPKFFISKEQRQLYKFPFTDLQIGFDKTDLTHKVTPRDEIQREAIAALVRADNGILNLACGKGKTTIALAAIATVNLPAIIIVQNEGLLTQWHDQIRNHLNYTGPIGVVQQKSFDWKQPITIAMIQTLAKHSLEWSAEFRRYFGIVVYDEVHHLAAPMFMKTADLFFGRRWGLTATATRSDGLESIYYYHLGQIIYQDLTQDLIPMTYFITTGISATTFEEQREIVDRSREVNIAKLRGWLGRHVARNNLILSEIKDATDNGRKILAITHSRDHAISLHETVRGSGLCIGGMGGEERRDNLRNHNITFATIQAAGEALDDPKLDTLFILTPFGDHNTLQQCLGRIQRSMPGKNRPTVLILEDDIDYCHGLCGKTRRYLRQQKYPFKQVRRQSDARNSVSTT
jgi:superfamily II DNA or RNA helicase